METVKISARQSCRRGGQLTGGTARRLGKMACEGKVAAWRAHALPEMNEKNFAQLLECSRFLKRDQKQSRRRGASADAPTRQDNWIKNRADAARKQTQHGRCPMATRAPSTSSLPCSTAATTTAVSASRHGRRRSIEVSKATAARTVRSAAPYLVPPFPTVMAAARHWDFH